ncbi:membrane protein [Knoellia sinensis KCTC 19936]|uniref:Membrane protein n=1 Tax=Knoellia sinensis KCTC 19936 TaxID=1385520 RepID=A0A0A0JA07_9MICO|nr:hypothetical protein [Knoellia sinensis]KGN34280.1 membrane protein [Knoellia sinensis KCTC 19936]
MSATLTTHPSAPVPPGAAASTPARVRRLAGGRAWAASGVAAGLAAIVGIAASMQIDAVYAPDTGGDPDRIVTRLGELVPQILVFHTATMLSVVLLLVFAAGLRRRLADQLPSRSLLPDVAAGGLGLVSVAGLLGSGLTTEFVFAVADPGIGLVPESAVFFNHWVGTIPWLWVGAGVAGVAVAIAALRHAAVARWVGFAGLVLGGLTLLLGLSPLQYMAGMTGPVWLLITALALTIGDRPASSGAGDDDCAGDVESAITPSRV